MKVEKTVALTLSILSTVALAKEPVDYVNPLIGTASRRADTGNSAGMMPYVCPPFAAVEWVPMTRLSEVGILSFAAPDRKFLGFIGSRQPAIWMGEWGQLSVMPQTSARPDCDYRTRGLELDKPKCIYTPYYAKVVTKEGVVAELAGVAGGTLEFEMEPPPLVGDGVADDTAAIQARIDSGASCVYLPPPKKEYLISRTLVLGSGQELKLDRFTRVRLAKGSSCFMLSNRNRETGDRRIALTGGIWDFDNVSQAPNPQQAHRCNPPVKVTMPAGHDPKFYWGTLMSFKCVDDLQIRHVTFRNPCSYSCQLASVSNFRVDDITFDFDKWNPVRLNMDGIHLDGDCHHGRITDLNGTCFDDLVAINANDGQCSPKEAPITDIEVDGIHAEYCHSAVRILSAGAEIRRVTVRNVFGNFYTYAVGLTHFFPKKPRGTFEDIVIENVFAAKALSPEDIGVRAKPYLIGGQGMSSEQFFGYKVDSFV